MTIWTPERDHRLLLLLLDDIRPNFKGLAAKWTATYVDGRIDDFQPTPLALQKHIAALKVRALKRELSTPASLLQQCAGLKATLSKAEIPRVSTNPRTSSTKRKRKRKFKRESVTDDEASDPVMSEGETDAELVLNTPTSGNRRISNRVTKPSKIKIESMTSKTAQEDDGTGSESAPADAASNYSTGEER